MRRTMPPAKRCASVAKKVTKRLPPLGPLTFGVTLGSLIGFALALAGLSSLQAGTITEDPNSVLVVAFGAATIGLLLGLIAEFLWSHPAVAAKSFIRHILRPITFCALPYLVLAVSLHHFGNEKLMTGFGFWFCVVAVPVIGIVVACLRKTDPKFDQRFRATTSKARQV